MKQHRPARVGLDDNARSLQLVPPERRGFMTNLAIPILRDGPVDSGSPVDTKPLPFSEGSRRHTPWPFGSCLPLRRMTISQFARYHRMQFTCEAKPMMNAATARQFDIFDRIRSACRHVADQAGHVRIRVDQVEPYASALASEGLNLPPLDTDRHVFGEASVTVAYFVTLDAINFGSGYFPYLVKRPGMSGYYTIASRLADRFRINGPLSAAELRAIAPRECAELFGQHTASFPIRELMGLFARALNDLGKHLETRYDGRFEGPIEVGGESAARLIELLSAQPFFRDEPPYRGLSVPLYKRAQLLVSDLALAFDGEGPGRFHDLDRLTIFADNLVPHVLKIDGLLEYSELLSAAIEREALIRAGSEEEIEIRACAVHCAELIREALEQAGHPISSRHLDQILWHRGQGSNYKSNKRHRTRTVFY
jgi:hypothetical protein